jgi:phosphate uptake regulator
VTDAYVDRDGSVADRLTERDEEIDDLQVSVTADIALGRRQLAVAIEMAIVALHEMVDSTSVR